MVDDHAFAVQQERKEKDYWFRESHESPIPHELRHDFRGLNYYSVEPTFRFRAKLTEHPEQEILKFPTSKGTEQEYFRHGYFEFQVEGKTVRLNVYKPVHAHGREYLFVPFRDATTGEETYGAGRYLDLEPSLSGDYDLDFNRAYNPYCAYSDDYICPLPPAENWLPVAIRAGEKTWTH